MRKSKNIHKLNKVQQSKKKITKGVNFRSRKLQVFVVVVVIAIAGASYLLFANAQSNNCQKQDGVDICDVNEVSGPDNTVLSTGPEAEALNAQNPAGWPWYTSTAFRAPMSAYAGAVPIHRVVNPKYSWHDWVTDGQKQVKEAKYGALAYEGVAFFAWDHQVPGTVPVYRLTQGGSTTKSWFITDKAWVDKLLAQDANNPDGWKMGTVMESIAFYAYPVNYSVPGTPNPGDCSKPENFVKDICKKQRENLDKEIKAGNVPASNACPATVEAYVKAIFPQQFTAECQQKWNDVLKAQKPATTPAPSNNSPKPGAPPKGGSPPPAVTAKLATASASAPDPNKPIDPCPQAPTMDMGLLIYVDGVNNKKKNYDNDCHKWYLTYAKNKNEDQAKAEGSLKAKQKVPDITKGDCDPAKQTTDYIKDQCAKAVAWLEAVNNNTATALFGATAGIGANRAEKNKANNVSGMIDVGYCTISADKNFGAPHNTSNTPTKYANVDFVFGLMSREDCLDYARAYRKELNEYHSINDTNRVKSSLLSTKKMDSYKYLNSQDHRDALKKMTYSSLHVLNNVATW